MTTITLPRATVEQALEALESVQPQNMGPLIHPAKQALRAALAQQAERTPPDAAATGATRWNCARSPAACSCRPPR